jgi:hypothetical protein
MLFVHNKRSVHNTTILCMNQVSLVSDFTFLFMTSEGLLLRRGIITKHVARLWETELFYNKIAVFVFIFAYKLVKLNTIYIG